MKIAILVLLGVGLIVSATTRKNIFNSLQTNAGDGCHCGSSPIGCLFVFFFSCRTALAKWVTTKALRFSVMFIPASMKVSFATGSNTRKAILEQWEEDMNFIASGNRERLSFALHRIPDAIGLVWYNYVTKKVKKGMIMNSDSNCSHH